MYIHTFFEKLYTVTRRTLGSKLEESQGKYGEKFECIWGWWWFDTSRWFCQRQWEMERRRRDARATTPAPPDEVRYTSRGISSNKGEPHLAPGLGGASPRLEKIESRYREGGDSRVRHCLENCESEVGKSEEREQCIG